MSETTKKPTSAPSSLHQNHEPLVTVTATPVGPRCPFGEVVTFAVYPGGCVHLQGPSGRGKTTIAQVLAGLSAPSFVLQKLDCQIRCAWQPSIPPAERCGVLFQQTTLLDELTVAGNLQVALEQCASHRGKSAADLAGLRKQLLDAVGLDPLADAGKRPTELSGGMARRASLALQLAQRKRIIVLDEPFTGLDAVTAVSVAKELVRLRQDGHNKTALVLIAHEPQYAQVVMNEATTQHNQSVVLEAPPPVANDGSASSPSSKSSALLFGTTFLDRFRERLGDYAILSLPLIALAFMACGLAIAMLSADLLRRLDITDQVLDMVDQEVRPLIKTLTGEEANAFHMMGVRFKVRGMLQRTVPPAKAALYAMGMAKLFWLEVGPLLTALLLCGRIGGSYAGRVATLQATAQSKLLQILGLNPQAWTLWPSLAAASLAAPFLTLVGTLLALYLGGMVGTWYGIGTWEQYQRDVVRSLVPPLRLPCWLPYWEVVSYSEDDDMPVYPGLGSILQQCLAQGVDGWKITTSSSSWYYATGLELVTHPLVYHFLKALCFIWIIIGVAEGVARSQPRLTPRGVPSVITFSVVLAGLLVIVTDWGWSQIWLLRE